LVGGCWIIPSPPLWERGADSIRRPWSISVEAWKEGAE
jgi:hypothetical protein